MKQNDGDDECEEAEEALSYRWRDGGTQCNSSPSSLWAVRWSFLCRASVLQAVIHTRLSAVTAQLQGFQHHDVSAPEKSTHTPAGFQTGLGMSIKVCV